jgi:hypothetical protein
MSLPERMAIKSWLQINAAVLLILYSWFKITEYSFKVLCRNHFCWCRLPANFQAPSTRMYMTYLRTNLDVPSPSSIVLVFAMKWKTENTFTWLPSCYVTYYETITLKKLIVSLKYITYTNLRH